MAYENRATLREAIHRCQTQLATRCALVGHMLAHCDTVVDGTDAEVVVAVDDYTELLGHADAMWDAYRSTTTRVAARMVRSSND